MTEPGRRWTYALAWLVGCGLATAALPSLRKQLSPWAAIGPDRIVMLSSDSCMTSLRATELIRGDSALSRLLVPVPADGPGVPAPVTCRAAIEILASDHWPLRILPEDLACRWLVRDASAVVPKAGVPTPSWYADGHLVPRDQEVELFRARGWNVGWGATGLRLWRVGTPEPEPPPLRVERIEDLGVTSYRSEFP